VSLRRLTERKRRWLAHRQRYEAKRRLRRKLGAQAAVVTVQDHTGKQWRARRSTGVKRLAMPEALCFDENPGETLAVLKQLRSRLAISQILRAPPSKRRRGRVSRVGEYTAFETMHHVSPAAALVLAAEYERILLSTGGRAAVIGVDEWDEAVFKTLWTIGFFDLVWAGELEEPDLSADVVVLRMQSGNTADPKEVDKLVSGLRLLYPGAADEPGDTEAGLIHLFGAMIEAVANVPNHAYPNTWPRVPSQRLRRWWMTGAVDRKNRRTTAVVFDQGVSIPVSLPNWAQAEGWGRRLRRAVGIMPAVADPRSDGEAIAAAVEEAVSSTGEHHRGTGLAQMRDFVSQCREGRLRIMSRCGEVVFRPDQEPVVKTYEVPLEGTLIEWSVFL
jgi:hypothetical protein